MSQTQKRGTSDFSIDRILAKDVSPSSSAARHRTTAEPICNTFHHPAFVHSTSSFVVQNKLDWLREVRELQRHKLENDQPKQERQRHNSNEQVEGIDSASATPDLSWLRCTRYRPPKLPRKSCAGKNIKRKLGSHPRIPFTKYQLEVLEEKYKTGAYLSRKDVEYLSDILQLPLSRIKIWFQNRRARERRESQMIGQAQST